MTQRRLAASLLAATVGVWASSAMAQDQAGQAPRNGPQPQQNSQQVQQVIVTAERRSEALQRVPMEVNAFNSGQLRSAGIEKLIDLTRVVPGLVIGNGIGNGFVFMRGVGVQTGEPGNEAGIANYVDDVYYVASGGLFASLANVQSVEVLKGPQGTLYGRNATGGLIHVITPDPQDTPHAIVRVGGESYNTFTGSLFATGPITDNLDASIALDEHYQETGFGKNLTLHGVTVNYFRYGTARAKLLWKPTSQDRVTLAASYYRDQSDTSMTNSLWPGTTDALGYKFIGTVWDTQAGKTSSNLTQAYDASLKWEHDFGDGMRFKSVTAYRDVVAKDIGDIDEPDPTAGLLTNFHKGEWSFQQEFLLQGTSKRLDWTAGLFYFTDGARFPINIIGTQKPVAPGSPIIIPSENIWILPHSTLISYAAFGQVDWHVTDSDTLTGGIRWTEDRQGTQSKETITGGILAIFGLPPTAVFPLSQYAHRTYRQPTWRLGYKHQFSNNLMAWASFSRGYRAGIFNTFAIPSKPVLPEILTAYEGGVKATLAEGRLQLGINGFYDDYRNIQLNSIEGTTSTLINAAKSEIYGVEIEGMGDVPVPVGDLKIRLNTGIMHSDFRSFPNCPIITYPPGLPGGTYIKGSCAGNQLPYTPRWTFALGPDYTVPLQNIGGKLELTLNYYHSSGFFYAPDNVFEQPAYDMLDAEVSYTFPNDRLKLRLYGHNITNTVVRYSVTQSNPTATNSGNPGSPAIFGGEVDYTFN